MNSIPVPMDPPDPRFPGSLGTGFPGYYPDVPSSPSKDSERPGESSYSPASDKDDIMPR
ncbi:MAG: hypothetical protein WC949_02065 [Candidatus Paceibacterota bacterium]